MGGDVIGWELIDRYDDPDRDMDTDSLVLGQALDLAPEKRRWLVLHHAGAIRDALTSMADDDEPSPARLRAIGTLVEELGEYAWSVAR